jgi:hypothetical protein
VLSFRAALRPGALGQVSLQPALPTEKREPYEVLFKCPVKNVSPYFSPLIVGKEKAVVRNELGTTPGQGEEKLYNPACRGNDRLRPVTC